MWRMIFVIYKEVFTNILSVEGEVVRDVGDSRYLRI